MSFHPEELVLPSHNFDSLTPCGYVLVIGHSLAYTYG